MERSPRPSSCRFVRLPEAAAYTGHTDKAFRKLVERRQVPFRRSGRRLLFDLVELEEWFRSLPGVSVAEALNRCGQPGE